MPRMIHSKAQWKRLFAMAQRGEIPMHKVKEMAEGVTFSKLPARKQKHSRKKVARELKRRMRGRGRPSRRKS